MVTGLWSGLWRVWVATVALLYIVGLYIILSTGVGQSAGKGFAAQVNTMDLADAWGFLTVLSALTIAAQVSATSTHQQRDTFARRRTPRFNNLAAVTGAVAIVGWLFFFSRFHNEEPAPLVLITAATAGIVYFAADAATMVVRADQRDALEARRWRRIRGCPTVVRSELKRVIGFPAGWLVVCVIVQAFWYTIVSALYVAAVAAAEPAKVAKIPPESVLPQFWLIWLDVVMVSAIAITLTVVVAALLYRKVPRGWRVAMVISGGALAILLICIPILIAIAPSNSDQPSLVVLSAVALTVAAAIMGLSPLAFPWRESNWFWTPRGSIRLGYAAIVALQLQVLRSSRVELDAAISAQSAAADR